MQNDKDKYGEYVQWQRIPQYKTYSQGAGYARAWLIKQDDKLITFNAYGAYQLLQMSRILSTIIGSNYRKTKVQHYANSIYLNGDGCVIADNVKGLHTMTLHFQVARKYRYQCEVCDEYIDEDNVFFHNDVTMCGYCYNENVTNCEDCEEELWARNVLTFENTEYCPDCYSDQVGTCEECDTEMWVKGLQEVDDVTLCSICVNTLKEEEKENEV